MRANQGILAMNLGIWVSIQINFVRQRKEENAFRLFERKLFRSLSWTL